jgi:hypothetical protein
VAEPLERLGYFRPSGRDQRRGKEPAISKEDGEGQGFCICHTKRLPVLAVIGQASEEKRLYLKQSPNGVQLPSL